MPSRSGAKATVSIDDMEFFETLASNHCLVMSPWVYHVDSGGALEKVTPVRLWHGLFVGQTIHAAGAHGALAANGRYGELGGWACRQKCEVAAIILLYGRIAGAGKGGLLLFQRKSVPMGLEKRVEHFLVFRGVNGTGGVDEKTRLVACP